mmetsp:Transcript_17563/g.23135  ORF Transcript_17563/g.23135 Transcript_17563/m.23135 type:complete len:227 (+) Transcript_17563:45-725(+)
MMHKMQTIARAIILLLLLISCLQADAYSFGIYGSQIQPKILKLKVDETTLSYKQTLKMTFSSTNRKDFLRQSLFSLSLTSVPSITHAAAAKQNFAQAKSSYETLLEARKQLDGLGSLIKEEKYEEVVEEIDGPVFSTIGDVMKNLVTSNVLSEEDKVSIGTIRRYGIAADVIITIGGLKAEIMNAEEDGEIDPSKLKPSKVLDSLQLCKNSLDEIIAICKNYKFSS